MDAALQRHQEESATNAQEALQKELQLMKQRDILEERCRAHTVSAKATFVRAVSELQRSCLAQVWRLWAFASTLSKESSSVACLSRSILELETRLEEGERVHKQQRAAWIAGRTKHERIMELAEVRSVKLVIIKHWQSVLADARHETKLQKAIEDERQSKSLNEWTELRRQVKDEREYRKFIFIAAINEQAKRRMHLAFYHWRGQVKIWALEAHLLAIEEEMRNGDAESGDEEPDP